MLSVKIVGLGVERFEQLHVSLEFDEPKMTLDANVSDFLKMSDKDEISFEISLPQFQCQLFECLGRIEFDSGRQLVFLPVRYFSYPQPEFLSLLPSGGPEEGGTAVLLQIRDFVGPGTR